MITVYYFSGGHMTYIHMALFHCLLQIIKLLEVRGHKNDCNFPIGYIEKRFNVYTDNHATLEHDFTYLCDTE